MPDSSVDVGLLGSRGPTPGSTPRAANKLGWLPGPWLPLSLLVAALLTLCLLSFRSQPIGAGMRLRDVMMKRASPELSMGGASEPQAQAAVSAQEASGPACPPAPACAACPLPKPCPPAEACPPVAACPPCSARAGSQPSSRSSETVQDEKQKRKQQQRGQGARGTTPAAGLPLDVQLEAWVQRLRVPWGPLLTQQEAERGLAYWGSGERLREVATKLMAGKPIKVYTLGASVTRGIGTTERKYSYASRFFEFINSAFPHKDHVFVNRGIGGTSSAIYSVCAEHMVDEDADLVVLEFSANDKRDVPYSDPERKGHEQLIRKLLSMRGRPAIIQLHHYAWWHAVGEGVADGGLFYFPACEAQLGVFAQYYDFPSVSVRAAMWHLMRARVDQFNPDAARLGATSSPTNYPIPGAEPGTEKTYWYRDRTHPGDEGHGMLAELLAHTLARAVIDTLAPRPTLHLASRDADLSSARDGHGLPLPMIPGNAATPTTVCAIEEDFKGLVVASSGFQYRPERPTGRTFVEQKWGWSSNSPGDWAEMEFDSESGFVDLTGNSTDSGAQVSLSYLKSYRGMGTADVECVSGCTCEPQLLDGTWETEVSLQQILQFWVSRHKRCRVRVTVSPRAGAVPQRGHKVQLLAVMVSHFSVRLTTYPDQVKVLHQATI